MAQTKKSGKSNKKTTAKNSNNKKQNAQKSLFDSQHKMIAAFIGLFLSVFMGAVVFIEAGGLWGILRNFFFGVFGLSAFIIPIFIFFVCFVCLIHKETRAYKQRVAECFVVFLLLMAFCHIVVCDSSLSYGEQITAAYKVFKDFDGSGMHYGYGVLGAILGGVSLLITAGSKAAAGVITVLITLSLVMIFWGTKIIRLTSKLKKPTEAVGDYAEEKIADIKETYETVSEDIHEKRAKNAAKRRKESVKKKVDLDVPVDDAVSVDNGVKPILDTTPHTEYETLAEHRGKIEENEIIETLPDFEDAPVISAPPLDELLAAKTPAEKQLEDIVEVLGEAVEPETIASEEAETVPEAFAEPHNSEFAGISNQEDLPEIKYELPPIDCLDLPKRNSGSQNADEMRSRGETIVRTLKSFGVGTRIVEICQSPSVTRFELQPEPGVKISRITALADDIAMNLAASGVRIEAPIPNKNAVGIEVPNAEKAMVTLREILESGAFQNAKSKLNVALGRDIQGEATCADLAKMPHLLVAGTTGSGKSVCLNTMIMSLLYNATPDEVKLIMIDPKKVEFTVYRSIPHLLVPVVADPRKAAGALSWAVAEMDKRYALFADKGVRNLQGYNNYALSEGIAKMPQIVIIIDELSDLMMAASNEVEDSICRLAQKARAAGMHLIVATQRPSVDVITGLIKANIPSRIAFAVKSQIDSRTIIDTQGAEKLLGNGDMLFCPVGLSKPVRVQGCYVSDEEIERVIDFVTSQGDVKYDDDVMREIELKAAQDGKKKSAAVETEGAQSPDYDDDMFPKAVEVVVENGMASTTLLQRKLKLGYARAARIVDELAEKGIIGPYEGAKPRKVLITKEQWYQMQANSSVSVPKQLSFDDVSKTNQDVEFENVSEKTNEEPNYFGSAVNTSDYNVED